jgi:predicted NBD/HSP70 family sugar kinase
VDSFTLLWLGHGIGLAIDLGGSLLRGARGGAGEIGYLPLPADALGRAPGPDSAPDLQRLIGGPAVIRLAAGHGIQAATAAEAVATAVTRDARDMITEYATRVAYAVSTVVAVLEPPLVVLAGEVAQAGGATLRDAVAAAMYPTAPQPPTGTRSGERIDLAVTAVEDDAVLLGGLDAGLDALRESLINSLAQPSVD